MTNWALDSKQLRGAEEVWVTRESRSPPSGPLSSGQHAGGSSAADFYFPCFSGR